MRLSFIVIGLLIVVSLVLFADDFSLINKSGPLDGTLMEEAKVLYVKSDLESTVLCEGREFRSVGAPVGMSACTTTLDCRENWPAGASFQFRDKAVCACGLCGEYL